VCLPGWRRRAPARPAIQPTPDPGAKPAIQVTPDFIAPFLRKPTVPSVCEDYRELIEQALDRGRNGNTIRSQDDSDKKELLKASILAFESYRRKEELDRLENIKDENLDQILEIFQNIDDLELSYYGQIVQSGAALAEEGEEGRKMKPN
jgi:hypothetical protein